MSSQQAQTYIVKPPEHDEEDLFLMIDENALLPTDQQESAEKVIERWLDHGKKDVYNVVESFKDSGALIVDKCPSQQTLIAKLPPEALEAISKLRGTRAKPLPHLDRV